MSRRDRLRSVLERTLEDRAAAAFVHVGRADEPSTRYCLAAAERDDEAEGTRAVAFTRAGILEAGPAGGHPAETLAERLEATLPKTAGRTLLTPRTIPHDAAVYLERAGFSLASSDALERARTRKTERERRAIERTQRAAGAGIRRGATVLEAARPDEGRSLEREDGEALTAGDVRIAIDEAIVRAGAFPTGETRVLVDGRAADADERLDAGEPIGLAVAPRGPEGYRGRLVRTVVVDGEGGPERRAHVAVTRAFASARALCANREPTVEAVAGDLEAEIRAFCADEAIETAVHGVGLEPRERPGPGDAITDGVVCAIEAAVVVDGRRVALADLLERTADGARWLETPSRSLEPSAY